MVRNRQKMYITPCVSVNTQTFEQRLLDLSGSIWRMKKKTKRMNEREKEREKDRATQR